MVSSFNDRLWETGGLGTASGVCMTVSYVASYPKTQRLCTARTDRLTFLWVRRPDTAHLGPHSGALTELPAQCHCSQALIRGLGVHASPP